MKLTRRTIIEFSIVILLFGLYALFYWDSLVGVKEKVDRDKECGVGTIIDYRLVGGVNHYLTYEYHVNGERFENTVVPRFYFKDCYEDRQCIGRRFRVCYTNENPKLSYIDLTNEIM